MSKTMRIGRWLQLCCGGLIFTHLSLSAALALPPNQQTIEVEHLGTYASGIFAGGASEIVAFDAATQRLFVVNGQDKRIDVLDASAPATPTFEFALELYTYGDAANSVAVKNGIVAVAVQANPKTDPGKAVFFDAEGNFLAAVTVGAQPDMIAFTPDGTKVLTANEAEPDGTYTIDPEGSVSIIDISGGVASLTQAKVTTAGFGGFAKESLDPSVRIFGPGASVAQDIEPEYISVSADSKTAWVTLQENNALAVLDLVAGQVTQIVGLGFKEHATGTPVLQTYQLDSIMPLLGTTAAGEEIKLGGFSGLYFDGLTAAGHYKFITHPDRGPNGEPIDVDGDGDLDRPFALPDFQPEIVFLEMNPATGDVIITERLGLKRTDGTPLTGVSNLVEAAPGFAFNDEEPVDLFGQPLPLDPFGADLEGIIKAPDGTFWLGDEYRPSIYHVAADGTLIARYVPEGSNQFDIETGVEALPAVYSQRRSNRGFEAIAYQNGKIYAFIQSPIDNPDVAGDNSSKNSRVIRILEFDAASKMTTAEYIYIHEGNPSDKMGDAVSFRNGEFLVVERDASTGLASKKKVFRISLEGATDIHALPAEIVGPGGTLELMTQQQREDAGIWPVTKTLYVDLAAAGYTQVEKVEGLAMIHPGLLVILNDNDFRMSGSFDPKTGLLVPHPNPAPMLLGLIKFEGRGLDASDEDSAIHVNNWPTLGMYLPDAIASFSSGGQTYLVTANEGDAREWGSYVEDVRVKNINLDPVAFPVATWLKKDQQIGRLKVTKEQGDLDGDGDYDILYSFGTRSFTIWTGDGQVVWDSGDELEQITAEALPANFNCNNEDNEFDGRSDDKGPEPEAVAIGKLAGRTYAFIGLERIGGVAIYDITVPAAPEFVTYFNNRDFAGDPEEGNAGDLGPEGVLFISAADSPTGAALLVTANEISGTTSIFSLTATCADTAVDLNGDCVVDSADVAALIKAWGRCSPKADCPGDIDGNGVVNGFDLAQVLASWG